jgi:hypothetical protein
MQPHVEVGHAAADDTVWGIRLEIIIAVLLGLAAVAAAFAAYRNETHHHEATVNFNEGIRDITSAAQTYNQGDQVSTVDQVLFVEYAKALNTNDLAFASYVHESLMTPELQKAVDWWRSQPNRPPSPFVPENPEYHITQYKQGDDLLKDSDHKFKVARKEQDTGLRFVLVEVILASALFLYGIGAVARRTTIKVGAVSVGAVIFVFSIVLMILIL